MLYLTIPLALILVALVGIAVLVLRKMSFLRKLTPEAHEFGDSWLHDMAPEVIDWYRSFPWRQYRHSASMELEKFLRRFRLMFMAIDRAFEQLVRKVRRANEQSAKAAVKEKEEVAAAKVEEEKKEEKREEKIEEEGSGENSEHLRQEEQRLIVAIAQNPRDAELYSDLARVYMKMHNFGDAVEALKAALKVRPEDEVLKRRLEAAQKRLAAAHVTV